MMKACMFISLTVNVILLVLLLARSPPAPPTPPPPVIGDLLDDAAALSCEGAKHLKEYDPRQHKTGTYVTEVDPIDPAKLPGGVKTYRLWVRCTAKE